MAEKQRVCPQCKESRVVEIIYGMPDETTVAQFENDEVALGGCMREISDPDWKCLSCGRTW